VQISKILGRKLFTLLIVGFVFTSLQARAKGAAPKAEKASSVGEDFAATDSDIASRLKETQESSDTSLDAKLVADPGAGQAAPAAAANVKVAEIPLASGITGGAAGEKTIGISGATTSPANTAAMAGGDTKAADAKAEASKLPEDQIPVLSSGTATKKAGNDNLNRIMLTLGVFAMALLAATFGLKRWAKKKGIAGSNTKIKVLTQHALGPKKSLCIVQVAGESILIGVTDHNISMLKTLSLIDDEVPADVPNRFDSTLSDYEDHEMASQSRVLRKTKDAEKSEGEDFTMRGLNEIRDTVSTRLRNMKNL